MASHRPSGCGSSANGTKTPGVSCCLPSAHADSDNFGDAGLNSDIKLSNSFEVLKLVGWTCLNVSAE